MVSSLRARLSTIAAMHSSNDNSDPVVVVLAAGHGLRFRASGAQTAKLQAQLHGRSVLEGDRDSVLRAYHEELHLGSAP